jgi:hypothetical protein
MIVPTFGFVRIVRVLRRKLPAEDVAEGFGEESGALFIGKNPVEVDVQDWFARFRRAGLPAVADDRLDDPGEVIRRPGRQERVELVADVRPQNGDRLGQGVGVDLPPRRPERLLPHRVVLEPVPQHVPVRRLNRPTGLLRHRVPRLPLRPQLRELGDAVRGQFDRGSHGGLRLTTYVH